MGKSNVQIEERSSIGEMTVEGLFVGIAAGIVMLLYLVVSGLLTGKAASVMISHFSIQAPANPMQGALLHLAVSGTYGLLFGFVCALLGRRFSVRTLALLYTLAIYLLARFVLLPSSGSQLTQVAPVHFALAHLVYGLVLGYGFARKTPGILLFRGG
jgi:hypothetical protein